MTSPEGFVSLLLLLVACGSKTAVPPASAPLHNVPAALPDAAPPDAPPISTCDEVGAKLAGGDLRADDIATTCTQFEWPESVRTCVTSNSEPSSCLDELSGHQRNALWGVVESTAAANQPASCDLTVWKIEDWPPTVPDDAPGQAWLTGARIEVALHECKLGWPQELKTCLAEAYEKNKTLNCLAYRMEDAARDALTKKLKALEKVAAKIEKAKKAPTTIDCDDVVSTIYGDAKWNGKLPGVAADERKRQIEKSRTLLLEMCESSYDEDTRACIVVTGAMVPPCFDDHHASLWSYPAWRATF
jgi:hypothetical protein